MSETTTRTPVSEQYWAMGHVCGRLFHVITHIGPGSRHYAACGAQLGQLIIVWQFDDVLPHEDSRCSRCPQTPLAPSWVKREERSTPAARQGESAALAALKLSPSDTYTPEPRLPFCPSCGEPLAYGAAEIIAALREPFPIALPDFIEAVRAIQRRNAKARWKQPTAATVLEALLGWPETRTTPEAICEAAQHWGACVGGGA